MSMSCTNFTFSCLPPAKQLKLASNMSSRSLRAYADVSHTFSEYFSSEEPRIVRACLAKQFGVVTPISRKLSIESLESEEHRTSSITQLLRILEPRQSVNDADSLWGMGVRGFLRYLDLNDLDRDWILSTEYTEMGLRETIVVYERLLEIISDAAEDDWEVTALAVVPLQQDSEHFLKPLRRALLRWQYGDCAILEDEETDSEEPSLTGSCDTLQSEGNSRRDSWDGWENYCNRTMNLGISKVF